MGFKNSNLPNQILFDNQMTSKRVIVICEASCVKKDLIDEVIKQMEDINNKSFIFDFDSPHDILVIGNIHEKEMIK